MPSSLALLNTTIVLLLCPFPSLYAGGMGRHAALMAVRGQLRQESMSYSVPTVMMEWTEMPLI